MRFFKRGHSRDRPLRDEVNERQEQKVRSARADKDYYKAMRRLALEAGDAGGVRFYDQKLQDIEYLEYEIAALEGRRHER